MANDEANEKYMQKVNAGVLRKPIQPGQNVCLYRPLSVDSNKRESWTGNFTVLQSNDFVSLIKDQNDQTQWVSNHHLRVIEPRPKRLEVDESYPDLPPVTLPKTSKLLMPVTGFKGGDSLSVEPASVKSSTPKPAKNVNMEDLKQFFKSKPPPTSKSINKSNASSRSISKRPAERPPGRPSRKRTKTDHFNIGTTSGKSYAAVAQIGTATCPSVSLQP